MEHENWFESDIAKKANEELAEIVSKLKDTSFLRHEEDGSPCLSVSHMSGSEGKIHQVGVKFKEKGSAELRRALERKGWKKSRREAAGTGLYSWYRDEPKEYYLSYEKDIHYVKYAIYQGKVGKYALEYIDSLYDERLKYTLGGSLVREENLPIVVNRVGGRHHFDPQYETGFLEVVELLEGEEPLTRQERFPKNSDKFVYGYIAPNGDTYACSFEQHIECAEAIAAELGLKGGNFAEQILEKNGFIKVSRPAPYTPDNMNKRTVYASYEALKNLTEAQINVIVETGIYDEDRNTREMIDMFYKQDEMDR